MVILYLQDVQLRTYAQYLAYNDYTRMIINQLHMENDHFE